MFAFQWRELSPPLSSAHRLLQCYHRQKRDRRRCNSRGIPPQPPPLANERAVSSNVEWASSLAVTLHILVGKICISFFLFYCEGMLSLVVSWLCGGGGGLREKYVFYVNRELQCLLSLFYLPRAEKILFAGRQTCSFYLVLWLCGSFVRLIACDWKTAWNYDAHATSHASFLEYSKRMLHRKASRWQWESRAIFHLII